MEMKERDNLTIEKARQFVQAARDTLEGLLRYPLDARESRRLLKIRLGAKRMVDSGLFLIGRFPELVGAGIEAEEVRRVADRQERMRVLADQVECIAHELRDTVRQDEVFLYKAVMTAYAVGQHAAGNAQIQQFVLEMKKSLASGPRAPRQVQSPDEHSAASL